MILGYPYWSILERRNSSPVAHTWHNGSVLYMHRLITHCPPDKQVYHIDGNGLNNKKDNLRICSLTENGYNRGRKSNSTTKYKGVQLIKASGMWRARVGYMGTNVHVGTFLTEKEAALAYNKAALFYYGEFAKLNEVEND